MYAYLTGEIKRVIAPAKSGPHELWLEVCGVGYRVMAAASTARQAPAGQFVTLYLSQSAAMYGGETTLYGFLSEQDHALFELLRDMPGVGAKKALDYFDKIQEKSPRIFLQALARGEAKSLAVVYGFTSKTVGKMMSNLKERAQALLQQLGSGKFPGAAGFGGESRGAPAGDSSAASAHWDGAHEALMALGFDSKIAQAALGLVLGGGESRASALKLEEVIRLALKELSKSPAPYEIAG